MVGAGEKLLTYTALVLLLLGGGLWLKEEAFHLIPSKAILFTFFYSLFRCSFNANTSLEGFEN